VIARYKGHTAQYLGDGLLAYFGDTLALDRPNARGPEERYNFSCTPPYSWYTRGVSSHARQRMGAGVCAAGPAHGAAERTGAWAS
jgi:hypothetical protein